MIIATLTLAGSIVALAGETVPGVDVDAKNLFNGTDLEGWHVDVPDLDENPAGQNPFIVRDGLLVSLGKPNGHLITDAEYQNYRRLLPVDLGVDLSHNRAAVTEDDPRGLEAVLFPDSSCRTMPQLIRGPDRDVRLLASSPNRATVRLDRESLGWLACRLSLPLALLRS